MALGQRPDRQPLTIAVAPDLLERLHPGTHPFRPHPLELHELTTVKARSDGGAASSSVHTGATSDVHTQEDANRADGTIERLGYGRYRLRPRPG